MTPTIEAATASDAKALSTFGARIFYETYIPMLPTRERRSGN
jgi:hypothetical protein